MGFVRLSQKWFMYTNAPQFIHILCPFPASYLHKHQSFINKLDAQILTLKKRLLITAIYYCVY